MSRTGTAAAAPGRRARQVAYPLARFGFTLWTMDRTLAPGHSGSDYEYQGPGGLPRALNIVCLSESFDSEVSVFIGVQVAVRPIQGGAMILGSLAASRAE